MNYLDPNMKTSSQFTEQELFRLKCMEHFSHPKWDTKLAFLALTEDPDIVLFIIRELGTRSDYFSDAQEQDLYNFIDRMMKSWVITERIRLHRIDFTILTLRLLLTLEDEIYECRLITNRLHELHAFDDYDEQ